MKLSRLLNCYVKVENLIAAVEGYLRHVDYESSHNKRDVYPLRLILENGSKLMVVKSWIIIKRCQ